jgi:hypothetical protein
MVNQNWNRWIFASVAKYFKDRLASTNIPFLIEGGQAKADGDSYEVRMSGPIWVQMSPKQWRGTIVINILVKATKDEADLQKIYKMVGPAESAFSVTIPVLTYGSVNGDNPPQSIGCLELIKKGEGDLRTTHFGQIIPETPLLQSTVEAHYKIDLIT